MKPNPGRVIWKSALGAEERDKFEHVVVRDSGVLEAFSFDEKSGHPEDRLLTLSRNITYEVDWL